MTPSLVFDHVWKQFRRGNAHDSLRELIPAALRRISGWRPVKSATDRDFWAIRDLSFLVEPGEVLGIIGSNGAGKSTVLKILNRVMEPTSGRVEANGKIGALIEVSAGFHQDLTGRQNVFLQGAIMGMRKAEVRRKFDEIVEFSGVEDFIDTPVKRYSSGMNARLGFSVAAHLEPDILIIDEVLAVGDISFQQKAFGRIKAMARAGAPVVLVSHQLDRIAELCTKAILLHKGTVQAEGTPTHCINEYLHGTHGLRGNRAAENVTNLGIQFDRIVAPGGIAVLSGQDLTVVVHGTADLPDPPTTWFPAFRVIDPETNTDVHSVMGYQRQIALPTHGEFEFQFTAQMNLPPGSYGIEPFIWDSDSNAHVITGPRLQFHVLESSGFYGGIQMNSRWLALKPGVQPEIVESVNGSRRNT
jgi:ABC-type polysaccharide/polyol phosphate transport system ATPase subunit